MEEIGGEPVHNSITGECCGKVGHPPAAGGLGGRASHIHDAGEFGGRVGFPLIQKGCAVECLWSMEEELNTLQKKRGGEYPI